MPLQLRHHILGAFVALHVVAVFLGALPAPVGGLNKKTWKDHVVASELNAWHETLRKVGMTSSREAFEEQLFQVAVRTVKFRQGLIAPFRPYYQLAGTTQGWRMFVAPMTRPATLRIEGRRAATDAWESLYVHQSDEADWYATQLGYSRVRPVLFRLGWSHFRKQYKYFAEHLALKAAETHPDLVEVRFVWERRRTPAPDHTGPSPAVGEERPLVFTISDSTP